MINPHESEPDGDRYLGHHFWIGLGVAIIGWMQWTPQGTPVAGSSLVAVGLLIAADDWISHYFGIPTPLDTVFKKALKLGLK